MEEVKQAKLAEQGSAIPLTNMGKSTATVDFESDPKSVKCLRLKLEWKGLEMVKTVQEGNIFRPKSSQKTILKDITGVAEPGELLAIMGPSGGGKTSLLNALSRRAKITAGKVTLNGKKIPKGFNKISAYVMQDDRLFEVLTPRELFQFSANLRLPRGTSAKEKREAVERVINQLKMNACADTRVGGHLMRGLSGGERKRTAIGYELITNPSLLFLDEPTSGLDSSTAYSLLQTLRELASEGHTVICTIHQPSSEIFRLFDKLNLLVKGQVAYYGLASDSISFFNDLGFPCPTYSNPADFFMELLQTQTDEQKARAATIVEAAKKTLPGVDVNATDAEKDQDLVVAPPRQPFYVQFKELTWRSWVTMVRNPLSFQAKIVQYIVIGLLVGVVYWDLSYNQTGVNDRTGALFFVVVGQVMSSLNSILLTFPLERALLIREQTNGMYGVSSYYVGKFISSIPLDIFFPTFFTLVIYWMVGFTSSVERFFLFLLTMVLLNFASASMGLLLGCMLPNAEVAVSLAPVLIIPFMLFAGFYVSIETIPAWLRWLQYLSLFRWGFQALSVNEFHDVEYTCTPDQLISAVGSDGQPVQVCPITNGNQILDRLGFEYSEDYWISIGVTVGLFIAFRLLAWGFLVWQTKRSLRKDQ